MAKKLRDVAVKTGEYQNANGETKGQWVNVGALMKGDDGNEFIILKRWFNPAGLANPENRDSIVLSCFKNDGNQGQQGGQQQQDPQQPAQQPQQGFGNPQGAPAPQPNNPPSNNFDDLDDDIPFS